MVELPSLATFLELNLTLGGCLVKNLDIGAPQSERPGRAHSKRARFPRIPFRFRAIGLGSQGMAAARDWNGPMRRPPSNGHRPEPAGVQPTGSALPASIMRPPEQERNPRRPSPETHLHSKRTHMTERSKTVTEERASGDRIAALRARRQKRPLRLAHSQESRWYWPRLRRWPSSCPLLRSRNSARRDSFRMDWFIGRRCGAIDTSGAHRGMHPRHPST